MRPRTYKYIRRLVERITRSSQSLNDSFDYYKRQVTLQSGMRDLMVVIVTETDDRLFGSQLCFDLDFDLSELNIEATQCRKMTNRLIEAFRELYSGVKVTYAPDYLDEITIQPKLPI